jgi:hypothetical protein
MLSFDDPRWGQLKAGYRIPVDLRPFLQALESSENRAGAWDDLWNELHHQGDVGEGSFVALPHLVRIHRMHGVADWNTYALAATIELARDVCGNPDVPTWSRDAYEAGLRNLATLGLEEISAARDPETVRSILGLVAIVHGARTYGRILVQFSEDEIEELERNAFGDSGGKPANKALNPAG